MTSASPAEPTFPASPRIRFGVQSTMRAGLRGTDNALGIVRLVLASLVIFDHAFPLGGWGHDPVLDLTGGQATLGSIAVGGFFAISGYLIAKSGQTADVVQFLWRRVLRIFPAFLVVLIVTAFAVGPVLWLLEGRSLGAYFTTGAGGPFAYITANWTLTIGQWGIHDLLVTTTPYGESTGISAFNGSLWTLRYEWWCYLVIAVFVLFAVITRARAIVVATTVFFGILQVVQDAAPGTVAAIVPWLADPYTISLGFTFLIGSCIALYADKVPLDDRLIAFAGALVIATLAFGGYSTIGTIAIVYLSLAAGARLPKAVRWIGAKNDYSYGVYIYGFLVQQVMAYFQVFKLGYLPFVLIAVVLALGLGWLSWHGIEKHAMKLKSWGPGRGVAYWLGRARSRPGSGSGSASVSS